MNHGTLLGHERDVVEDARTNGVHRVQEQSMFHNAKKRADTVILLRTEELVVSRDALVDCAKSNIPVEMARRWNKCDGVRLR